MKTKNLAKLGKLKSTDRVAKAMEETGGDVEAASAKEKQTAWQKHQTWLKNQGTADQNEEYKTFGKKAKGLQAVMQLIKSDKPAFISAVEKVSQQTSMSQKEKWKSWHVLLKDFDEDEARAHLSSGSIMWRNDPWTAGYHQYLGQGDLTKVAQVKAGKDYNRGQEYNPEERDHLEREELTGNDPA